MTPPRIRGNPAAQLVAIVDPAETTWSKYNLDMMPTPELATLYGEARLQLERYETGDLSEQPYFHLYRLRLSFEDMPKYS